MIVHLQEKVVLSKIDQRCVCVCVHKRCITSWKHDKTVIKVIQFQVMQITFKWFSLLLNTSNRKVNMSLFYMLAVLHLSPSWDSRLSTSLVCISYLHSCSSAPVLREDGQHPPSPDSHFGVWAACSRLPVCACYAVMTADRLLSVRCVPLIERIAFTAQTLNGPSSSPSFSLSTTFTSFLYI